MWAIYHLPPPRMSTEAGLPVKHSNMECGYHRWHFNQSQPTTPQIAKTKTKPTKNYLRRQGNSSIYQFTRSNTCNDYGQTSAEFRTQECNPALLLRWQKINHLESSLNQQESRVWNQNQVLWYGTWDTGILIARIMPTAYLKNVSIIFNYLLIFLSSSRWSLEGYHNHHYMLNGLTVAYIRCMFSELLYLYSLKNIQILKRS